MSEGRARGGHPRKVLFVCRANICRSPMAEAILDARAQDGRLPLRAASAGVAALAGEEMAPNSRREGRLILTPRATGGCPTRPHGTGSHGKRRGLQRIARG